MTNEEKDKQRKRRMSKKKIYRTIIRFEVLSDEPIQDNLSLEQIAAQTYDGDLSGRFLDSEVSDEELVGKIAVEAIADQGSDPEFFGLDENGNELE